MGFVYHQPLTIEQIFYCFDSKKRDGKISRKEAKMAENFTLYKGFVVEKGMTFDTFKAANQEVYDKYLAVQKSINEIQQKYNEMMEALETFKRMGLDKFDASNNKKHEQLENIKKKLEKHIDEQKSLEEIRKMSLTSYAELNGVNLSKEDKALPTDELQGVVHRGILEKEARDLAPKLNILY